MLVLMIFIGGLIGYTTNKIAVKMLFRPIKPVKILFFTFQGLLPKRKVILSEKMAETIEEAFLSKETIVETLFDASLTEKFKNEIKKTLKTKITTIIPPMMKAMFGHQIDEMIVSYIDQEGQKIIEDILEELKNQGSEKLNIKKLVKERVDALDFYEFEKLVYGIVKKELRHIEFIGLVLGMLIGLMQYFITSFTQLYI